MTWFLCLPNIPDEAEEEGNGTFGGSNSASSSLSNPFGADPICGSLSPWPEAEVGEGPYSLSLASVSIYRSDLGAVDVETDLIIRAGRLEAVPTCRAWTARDEVSVARIDDGGGRIAVRADDRGKVGERRLFPGADAWYAFSSVSLMFSFSSW